jgi:hypothetical protein
MRNLSNKNIIRFLLFIIIVYIYSYFMFLKEIYKKPKDISLIWIENELKYLNSMNKTILKLNFKQNSQHTTIISMFFRLNISKHSNRKYKKWMRNILLSVNSPMAIYTDYKSKDFIELHRSNRPTILYLYESIWQLMRELEIKRNKPEFFYIKKYVYSQIDKDPEKSMHNPNLYAIWNLKAFIADRISRDNPFGSKFFIYSDMGAWRDGLIPKWPNKTFARLVSHNLGDKIMFSQINKFKTFSPYLNIIEGGFFAGNRQALRNFEQHFYNLHDERLNMNYFIGKDQIIMNIMAFQTHRRLIARLNCYEFICNKIYNDSWFFYQIYFAQNRFYKCNHDKLSLIDQ